MATDVKSVTSNDTQPVLEKPITGWYPLSEYGAPAIGYKLTPHILYDIIKALLATMPISEEKEHYSRSHVLHIGSFISKGQIRITRTSRGYTASMSKGNMISFGKIYPDLYSTLLAIKENTKDIDVTSIIIFYNNEAKRRQGTVYHPLSDNKDYSLDIIGDKGKAGTYGVLSPGQSNIVLNKVPINSIGEYHGIEGRFFFTLDGKAANYRYWLHSKEVTLSQYAEYIARELRDNTPLIPDLAAIAGAYLL